MEPEVSWPCIRVKEPTSRLYPVPHESSPRFSHLICKTHFTLVLPYKPVFQVASFFNIALLKFCVYSYFSSFPHVSHAPPISSFLILSPFSYLMKNRNHAAPHYAITSSSLVLPPFYSQMSFSVPCFRTPSDCVLLLVWQTKFDTRIQQQAKCIGYACVLAIKRPLSTKCHILSSSG